MAPLVTTPLLATLVVYFTKYMVQHAKNRRIANVYVHKQGVCHVAKLCHIITHFKVQWNGSTVNTTK